MSSSAHHQSPADALPAPMVLSLGKVALFADLDGTLAPIEATPQAVGPNASRRGLIDGLTRALSGRFAVVSGRSLADIDRVLEGRVAAVAAVHGLVRRDAQRNLVSTTVDGSAIASVLEAVNRFAAEHPDLIVEDKGLSIALHYRQSPANGPACHALVTELAARLGLEVQEGDMVIELRLRGPDKGEALAAFMTERPFAGYAPVFVGDDFTDESGFRAARSRGGFGVIVGPRRPTLATYALADVSAARTWLQRAVDKAA